MALEPSSANIQTAVKMSVAPRSSSRRRRRKRRTAFIAGSYWGIWRTLVEVKVVGVTTLRPGSSGNSGVEA